MLNKTYICLLTLTVISLTCLPASPWFLDRGLEKRNNEMKRLFIERRLTELYSDYVDIRLKIKIGSVIEKMRKDRVNGYKISKSLGYKRYKDYLAAEHIDVTGRFFSLMLNPPKRKIIVKNAEYLKLGLLLSLLFAHYDKGMVMADKRISGNSAKIYYSGNGFKMVACFVYKNDIWYLSEESLLGK